MGWMVRLGESDRGRRLITVFAPKRGRREDTVQEQAGGPGRRRICLQCGAAVADTDLTCPVDGGRVLDLDVHIIDGKGAAATGWGDAAPPVS